MPCLPFLPRRPIIELFWVLFLVVVVAVAQSLMLTETDNTPPTRRRGYTQTYTDTDRQADCTLVSPRVVYEMPVVVRSECV